MTQYPSLFSPGRIGSMTLKNRGVMMPMATEQADRYGVPTLRQIRYYQERAKGGVAMIINEYTGSGPLRTTISPSWKS